VVPAPSLCAQHGGCSDSKDQLEVKDITSLDTGLLLALASGLATLIGWCVVGLRKNPSERFVAITLLIVAIVMLTISTGQLIPSALDSGLDKTQVAIATTVGLFLVLSFSSIPLQRDGSRAKNQVLLITVALSFHNLPEGAAPIGATLVNVQTGISTAVVLALHNIPEGIAISATALMAGYGRRIAFYLTLTATLAEILGAIAVYLSKPLLQSEQSVGFLLSGVAGIMIAICVKELIPHSFKVLLRSRHV